jgi:hypothetical protein
VVIREFRRLNTGCGAPTVCEARTWSSVPFPTGFKVAHSITSSAKAISLSGILRPSGFGRGEIDNEFKLGRLHNRKISWFGAFAIEEEAIIVAIRLPCRRCSPNGFARSPERHTEGR